MDGGGVEDDPQFGQAATKAWLQLFDHRTTSSLSARNSGQVVGQSMTHR